MQIMNSTFCKRFGALVGASFIVALAGCGGGGGGSSPTPPPPPPPSYHVISGTVTSGDQPIVGATVTAWAANPTPGASATKLGQATSDDSGKFSVDSSSKPGDGELIYVTSAGGDAGAGKNNAIALATVAGTYCTDSGCTFPANVTMNELTTVYTAYTLAAFTTDNGGGVNVSGASPGLPNAALTFASLVDAASGTTIFVDGTSCTGSGEPADCGALRKMNTLANFVAACVDSSGASSDACTGLLQQTSASDTFSAVLHLATEAAVRNDGAGLYGLGAPQAVYMPVLGAAPADWTLVLIHAGGGLDAPTAAAVDSDGNVWVANNITDGNTGSVTEFSPTGEPLSPAGGFTDASMAGPIGIAVDEQNNVWVANFSQGGGKAVTELDNDGNPISGPNGYTQDILGPAAFAVTATGKIWVANSGNSSLVRLDASGTPDLVVSQEGGLAFPISLATDSLGDVWVADQGGDRVSEFDPDGNALSPSSGYTGGGISGPEAIAVDQDDNVWVANHLSGIAGLFGGNTPPGSCPATPVSGDTGCPFSPPGGFTGGGLLSPAAVAVDGAGYIWFSNYLAGSVSEFDHTGVPLSPDSGYKADGNLLLPYGLAVDASGNLWVTNYATNSVVEFVGIAAPVKTPLIGPPQQP